MVWNGTYPADATEMAAAFGGTWTGGSIYDFTAASGNIPDQLGSIDLQVEGDSPTAYQQAGALSAAHAVLLDPDGAFRPGSPDDFDVGDTEDLIVCVLLKDTSFFEISKANFAGWRVGLNNGSVGFGIFTGSELTYSTATIPTPAGGGWVLLAGVLDRSSDEIRAAAIADGVTYMGSAIDVSSAPSILDPFQPMYVGFSTVTLDGLWIAKGTGIATGLAAGLQAAIESLYETLQGEQPESVSNNLLLLGCG